MRVKMVSSFIQRGAMINWHPWLRSEHPTKSAELDEFIYHEPLAGEGTMRVCCFGFRTGYLYEFSEVFQGGSRFANRVC